MTRRKPLYNKLVREIIEGTEKTEDYGRYKRHPRSSLRPAQVYDEWKEHIEEEDDAKCPAYPNYIRLIVWKQSED